MPMGTGGGWAPACLEIGAAGLSPHGGLPSQQVRLSAVGCRGPETDDAVKVRRILGMPRNEGGTHGSESADVLTGAAVVYLYKPLRGAKTNRADARVPVGSIAYGWRSRSMMRSRHDDRCRDRTVDNRRQAMRVTRDAIIEATQSAW
jgi:hypothetical protein